MGGHDVADEARSGRAGGPSAFLDGPGHVIRYGNAAFKAAYGGACTGQPASEVMTDLPRRAFELLDRVLRDGRAYATRVALPAGACRLVAAPRRDPETGETYGVILHLRPSGPDPGDTTVPGAGA